MSTMTANENFFTPPDHFEQLRLNAFNVTRKGNVDLVRASQDEATELSFCHLITYAAFSRADAKCTPSQASKVY